MDIRLYIDNMQVDLNDELQILFNWQESDLSNPTIIKNGYSKTIVLEGTNTNNEIFGHFWNLERFQAYNGGNTRSDFNPSYRVPFTLYYNGSVYEKGYVKLQRVIRNNGINRFEIGLFGGLGTFLYNLSTDWNTGEKKTLADLNFFGLKKPKIYSINATTGNVSTSTTAEANDDTDLSFTINSDTIVSAWTNVTSNGKWGVINFAPTYNGYPDNLDADKVLINFKDFDLQDAVADGSSAFTTYNGYALGKLPSKLTMEETKDYRSYLQTPIVRTKSIIEAICMKENNKGKYDNGYDVVLDDDFFTTSNPYYWDSWITLPKLNLSYATDGGVEVDMGAVTPTYEYSSSNSRTLSIPIDNPVGTTNKIKVSFDLHISVPNATADRLYLASAGRNVAAINALAVQAYASNSLTDSEYVYASSPIEWLTNTLSNGTIYTADYAIGNRTFTPRVNNSSNVEDGSFVRVSNGIYRWNRQIVLECDFPENASVLKIDFQLANSEGSVSNTTKICPTISPSSQADYFTWVKSSIALNNSDMILTKASTENFYSNQVVTKDALLSTSYSPAEFLVSFCKMFGLYIHKDIVEDKIYISTRNNYFKRDNIINLEEVIDVSKDIEITPVFVDTNYVSLTNEAENSASIVDYKDKYGKEFGQKVVDTGFEFNADTKELNEESIFKTAAQTKEQSQYFYQNRDGKNPYVYNGFSYTLYNGGQYTGDTRTIEVPKKEISTYFQAFNENYKYYDVMSKAQFEDKQHKGLPTENVFLFFNGFENVLGMGYYLTDDVQAMSYMNNKPCWLMTKSETDINNNKIATAIEKLPRFSRYFEGNHWMMYSWDYGSPREIYVPDIQNNDEGNIYHIYFKNYFEDLYDVNTKVITCYIKDKNLTEDSLRNIYWFRNGLWRLNRVYDYNPSSPNTTKCEFIKIQDLSNFDIDEATTNPWVNIKLDKYYIEQTGGTIIGTVRTWDNYGWQIEGIGYDPYTPLSRGIVTVTPDYYGQSGNFILTVPANIRDDREVTIYVTAGDIGGSVSFRQPGVEYTFGFSPAEFNGSADGYTATLNINNPYYYDWFIMSKPDWITITPSQVENGQTGTTGNVACTITVAQNTSSERTGMVTIAETTYGRSYTFPVKQAGNTPISLTGITIDGLTWITDVPAAGGTATKSNCTYTVTAHYSNGTTANITTAATITGSLNVASSTNTSRHSAGTLTLTASYSGFTNSASVTVYQAAYSPSLLTPRIISIDADYEETPDPTPTGFNVECVFGASQDFGTFTITTNGIAVTVDGISDDPTVITNVIAGDTLQFVVTNNTSSTVNIGLAYAPASTVPSYTWNNDIAPNGSAGLYVASAVENYKLYINVNN